MTISGGLVLLQSGEDLDAAVKRADLLLYQAKSGGRNRIVSDLAVGTDNAGDPGPAGAPGNIPSTP
ncbi:diguanylate cyclase [compost metagenome]